MECIVPDCPNKIHQGRFVGEVCMPCANLAKDLHEHGELQSGTRFVKGVREYVEANTELVLQKAHLLFKEEK